MEHVRAKLEVSERLACRVLGLTTIFIHDAYPGGAGISERGFRHIERLLEAFSR